MRAAIASVLALLLTGAVQKPGGERSAREALEDAFRRARLSPPAPDPILDRAARALAAEALLHPGDRPEGARVRAAVIAAGGWDPNPRLLLVRASPPEALQSAFRARSDLAHAPSSHVGLAQVEASGQGVLAVLLTTRRVQLEPFPRALPGPRGALRLCGTLSEGFAQPTVFAEDARHLRTLGVTGRPGGGFCARVELPDPGTVTVKVSATGPDGPAVLARFTVDVGPAAGARESTQPPANPRADIRTRIDRLRAAAGIAPLAADARLDAVAQAFADRMVREHFFSHVSPDGRTLTDRLASLPVQHVGENLGRGPAPESAAEQIELSPSHRATLLDARFTQLGLGLASLRGGPGPEVLLVQVFASGLR